MDNRTKFKALCKIAGSYPKAAEMIATQTEVPLSLDTVKSWTCKETTTRARPCPDWAVNALEKRLKALNKITCH